MSNAEKVLDGIILLLIGFIIFMFIQNNWKIFTLKERFEHNWLWEGVPFPTYI